MSVMTEIAKEAEPDLDFAGLCASQIYENWDNPSYRNAFLLAFGTHIENDIWSHRHEWQHLVSQVADNHVNKARRAVIKAYLSSAIEEVRKDVYDVQGNRHDRSGRFGNKGPRATGLGGLSRAYAAAGHGHEEWSNQGNTSTMGPITDQEARARLAARLGGTVNAYSRYSGSDEAQGLHFTIEDKKGNERYAVSRNGRLPRLKGDERVTAYKPIGIDQPITVGGETFNLMQALGSSPEMAGRMGALHDGVQSAAQAEGGAYGRIHDASKTFYTMAGGAAAPPAAQAAAAFGMYVGKHGPEVARVLGPHMRRYTYKYRGFEANPQQLSSVAKTPRQEGESQEAYEYKLVHALASQDKSKGGMNTIPTAAENTLLLGTGSTAPSHGFLLDKTGKVRQQVVGVADDHYVPFNLSELHALNGGSYVRSRSYGGPTTEDMSLALRTGTKRFTTVSRHGAYTVELEQRANGVRSRYGDVPVVVVNRYGRLLDAVQSGKLVDPATGTKLQLNGRGYEVALAALKTQFPLLIKDVSYTPPSELPSLATHKESEGSYSHEDTGYVRPYYLKPSAAVNGYYDEALGFDGQTHSYDELEGYRLHKANVLLAEKEARDALRAKQAQAASNVRPGYAWDRGNVRRDENQANVRDGRSPVPLNLTPAERRIAEAGGGTSSSETLTARQALSTEDLSKLVGWARASVRMANNSNDPEEKELRDILAGGEVDATPQQADKYDEWTDSLKHNSGARAELADLVTNMAYPTGTGLEPLPLMTSAGDEDPREHASDDNIGALEALQDSEDHQEYTALNKMINWERTIKNGGTLKEEKQRQLDGMRAYFGEPDPNYIPEQGQAHPSRLEAWTELREFGPDGNLTYKEHHENKLAEAAGGTPPHKGPEDVEPNFNRLARARTPQEQQKAQDDWENEMIRGIGDNDFS